MNPRDVVPESNMPGFPWLEKDKLDGSDIETKMRALRTLGVPYTDAQINMARDQVAGHTEMEALIAYLQGLKYHGESKQ